MHKLKIKLFNYIATVFISLLWFLSDNLIIAYEGSEAILYEKNISKRIQTHDVHLVDCFNIEKSNNYVRQIDVLHAYGNNINYTTDTLETALEEAGIKDKIVLVLQAGYWKVSRDLIIPNNVSLYFEKGAILSIEHKNTILIYGSIIAGRDQIFQGPGYVRFRHSVQDVLPEWWKDKDDKVFTYAIQKALSSGASAVFFSEFVYEVSIRREYQNTELVYKPIQIPSEIRLHGVGKGSVIKLVDAPTTRGIWSANDVFAGNNIENVEISDITFDGEKYYPDPEKISRLDPLIRGTRAINIQSGKSIKISNCNFRGFTNGSIIIKATNALIDSNYFFHGSYRTQTIRMDSSKHITVSNNIFEDNGPHYYMVLGRADETSSVDVLMVGYKVDDAQIVNNKISKCAGIGIRVEDSKNVHVMGNLISDTGEDGITFYLRVKSSSCIDNNICNWGRLNNFGYIRKQNGIVYNPIEYHYPPPDKPQLPKNLNNASTWRINRYYLQARDESTIPEYDPTDYKMTLAFRGFSAISVTELSENIFIKGNRITGNITKTDGLYNYASNYGINIGVHCINPPTSSGDCVVVENSISGCIDYDIFCPQYVDPTSKRGVAKASIVLGNKCDPLKVLFFYKKSQ